MAELKDVEDISKDFIEQDKRETLNLLLKLPKPVRISIGSLTFFPTYPLTEIALKDKIISENLLKICQDKILSTRYGRTISLRRNREDIFWSFMYTLIMIGIPNRLIVKVSYSKIVRKNGYILAYILDKLIATHNFIMYKIPNRTIADKFFN